MRKLDIAKNDESVDIQINRKNAKTLLQHIECIIETVENSKLSEEFFQKAKKNINFVAKKMKLTTTQAVLFSVFIENSNDDRIYINDLSEFIGCRNIKTISLMNDIDELEKRRLIRCRRDDKKNSYRVPIIVVNAIKQNIVYEQESYLNLDTKGLFKHIYHLFCEKENNEISNELLLDELRSLLEDNPSLSFCKQIKEFSNDMLYLKNDFLLLLFFCHCFVNLDEDSIGFYDIKNIFEGIEFRRMKSSLKNGDNELLLNNILENCNDNGFGNNEYFKISDIVKEKLFVELDIKIQQTETKKGLILHNNIVSKQLFYNEREQSQIRQLSSLLSKKSFLDVQTKLEKNGMRKGFACLFYGAPGTGKTETVYQIARSTGRDIMMVDISETKSMWFGESEKRIKKIFDTYRSYLKTCKIAPILLFNEADAVIGKRKVAGNSPIDQTENAIQNIILQEMENLEGIMIATTNLTRNLDKAFERRFLYKIEFDKPEVHAKERIWNTMLPSLSEQERLELAKCYNFSGGQIENIVRKYTVDCILNSTNPSMEAIHLYCQSEFLYKNEEQRKIGY